MLRYRIRFLDGAGRADRTFIIWNDTDDAVLSLVRRLEHPGRVEVYRDEDVIARFNGPMLSSVH